MISCFFFVLALISISLPFSSILPIYRICFPVLIFNYFLFSFLHISSPCSLFLSVFCLLVLLSSFCPISKSSYEPSLLSVKSNAVSFNRSWINSHGFHLPIFFFLFPCIVCLFPDKNKSWFLLPFSTSLEFTWTFLSITYLTPFCSPSLGLSSSFLSLHLTVNNLPKLPSPQLPAFRSRSTPAAVGWEHLIHISD